MKQHFDEGIIQSFVDGELNSDLSEKVVQHIAVCDACATLLAETEESNEFAFSALNDELNVLVPTERLRTKVFASIEEAENKKQQGLWNKLTRTFGFVEGFSFAKPSLAAFASLLLFVGMFAFVAKFYKSPNSGQNDIIVSNKTPKETKKDGVDSESILVSNDKETPENTVDEDGKKDTQEPTVDFQKPRKVYRASGSNKHIKPKRLNIKANKKIKTRKRKAKPNKNKPKPITVEEAMPLAGEDSYLQTIATLSKEVDRSKDIVLRPKERIAFEKDLAILNVAIKRTKAEVRKNPKNKAAREVLKASYKNKINLLNSVSEKSELMAGL